MNLSRLTHASLALLLLAPGAYSATYAERLGWKPTDRVIIFHCDDAGMSHSSNAGAIEGLEKGMLSSVSVMMPCSWVPEFAKYLEKHPNVDSGLHLTLTSEWDLYRWGPVAGKLAVPGLVDKEGCLWDNVDLVVKHASPDEVEKEIRAQIDRAQTMGIPVTHLDSHMGTLFASREYFERLVKIAIEKKLPVLAVGGHMTLVTKGNPEAVQTLKGFSEVIWNGGLPVIDDIFAETYDWNTKDKTALYADLLTPHRLHRVKQPFADADARPVFFPDRPKLAQPDAVRRVEHPVENAGGDVARGVFRNDAPVVGETEFARHRPGDSCKK